MPFDLKKRFENYIEPWEALSFGATFFFQAIKPGAATYTRGRDQAFASWYKTLGHHFSAFEAGTTVPDLVAACRGVVLELGPATGNQLPRFTIPNLTHVYGIEPNNAFVDSLQEKITETGLESMYTPITCGIEDVDVLETCGITEGSAECLLSIQVLCSVARPEEAAKAIYRLLKVQVGGCRLSRPTKEILLQSGDWEVIEMDGDEEPWSLFPRVWGRLRKLDDKESRLQKSSSSS
ncbi:MAG: hypothetical protein M1818_003272 [Claussenomyces sp. TS43310]|nr:MAG: hypothetical protein M1818_003272 [Claussenomyces sp. TS43310]